MIELPQPARICTNEELTDNALSGGHEGDARSRRRQVFSIRSRLLRYFVQALNAGPCELRRVKVERAAAECERLLTEHRNGRGRHCEAARLDGGGRKGSFAMV